MPKNHSEEDISDTEGEPSDSSGKRAAESDSTDDAQRKRAEIEAKELRGRLDELERLHPSLKSNDRGLSREVEKLKHQNTELQKKLERREEEIFQLRIKLPPPDPKGFAYFDEADSAASMLIISNCPPEAKDCLAAQIPEDCKISRTQAQMLDMMVTGAENEIDSLKLQLEELTDAHETLKKKFRAQTKTLDTQTKMITDLMNANVAAMNLANLASAGQTPTTSNGPMAVKRPGKLGANWFSIREFEKQELAVRGSIFELQTTKKALEAEIARLSKLREGR
jgi:predicted nuclease with TOPRIM domain